MAELLRVEALCAGYDAPRIKGVSFAAEEGEIIGILGRNGCGKTTLLRGILGSIRRFGGSVHIRGVDCTRLSAKKQAAFLSLMPQQTRIMEGILVRDLIAMGRYPHSGGFADLTAEDAQRIREAAKTMGVGDLLDTDCAKLSQGQRQLAMLARLLVQDTPVMLLDEPNSALDYDNTHILFSELQRLVHGKKKAALVVLHDPELALRWCDRLLLLRDGQLTADLSVANAGGSAVTASLRKIYPRISLRRDPFDGSFRCYTDLNDKEADQC